MTSPLLSIIISTFNDKERVIRCLNSINHQSFQDFEVIIINDQSTDGSDQLIKTYCEQHSRFFYYEGVKKGAYQCRNQALDLCKGTYIGFMDTDDWIELNMFQCLVQSCIEFKADSSICSVKRFDEKTGTYRNHFDTNKFPSVFNMDASYLHRISGGTTHKLFLRKNIEKIQLRFLEYKTSADLEFNWRYYLSYPKTTVTNDTWYNYTIRDNSLVTTKHGKAGLDIIKVFSAIKKLLISADQYKKYKRSFLTVAIARLQERFHREHDDKCLFVLMMVQCLGLTFFLDALLFILRKKIQSKTKLVKYIRPSILWLNQKVTRTRTR